MKKSKFLPAKAFLDKLSSTQRSKAKVHAKTIIASELGLAGLRQTGNLTQSTIGTRLKISQDQVSRLEKRTDILLSTLKKYVSALGGNVHIMVELPGRPPIKLADLTKMADFENRRTPKTRVRPKAA
jgi:Helix-turn-helix domain